MNKIILASGSARRKEIMNMFHQPFTIKVASIEEKINIDEKPSQVAMALAFEKANAVAKSCKEEEIVIAADTIVVKDRILGKPKDDDEAFSMIKSLQNHVHTVISGLAVVKAGTCEKIVCYEETTIKFKPLTDSFIKRYVQSKEGQDKAGAYAIQGKGAAMVEWIKGDYFNVVGLPISKLYDILSKYFKVELIQDQER